LKINSLFRLATLLAAAFILGGICYKQFTDFHKSATIYLIPRGEANKWLSGEWTVAELAGTTQSTMMDKPAALALIGKLAQVKSHEFAFDDMRCPTSFNGSIEQPKAFLQDYGATPFIMHMDMPSTRIDAGCADLYPIAHDVIVISYEGYFLEAIRKPTTVVQASSAKAPEK
jgi:hypothetical protein